MLSGNLFPEEQIVGVFRGFTDAGLEFHADLALPYRNEFQSIPMHGQFVLVQLETPQEAVLGRITALSSEGRLASGPGEEFNIRAARESRPVPEDLREQYLKYRVKIRVLGLLRQTRADGVVFVPSQRRLPHVGSPVAFPSNQLLQELAGHNGEGVPIGFLALGEYIFAGSNQELTLEPWMRTSSPEILVRFAISSLVSRRSFVFARAGFGKSNLNKLLFSELYATKPVVQKRGGREVPVGTVLFDPEGEYFWPDDKDRPGLCDVPHLQDQLVVFTSRAAPSPFYQSFVAGDIRLDLRRFRPADVLGIAMSPERQEQQNIRKLKGMNQNDWEDLIALIDRHRNNADLGEIQKLLRLEPGQESEALAARANVTSVVSMLHDQSSQLVDMLLHALSLGKLCVVDTSQMRGGQALILTGLLLRRIFDRNQEEFTAAVPRTIPTIAVIEEAQTVLNSKATGAEPYITWVKEGRKYDLGALMITQQPGSIPQEILSQGDNWFIFHLLSAADLHNVRTANAHFSQDILSVLLNEPIPGQGVFWSSAGGRAYPLPVRIMLFETRWAILDPNYDSRPVDTFAQQLRREFEAMLEHTSPDAGIVPQGEQHEHQQGPDPIVALGHRATEALSRDDATMGRLRGDGYPWGGLNALILEQLPENLDNRSDMAFRLVPRVLSNIFGRDGWHSFRNPATGATWIKSGPEPS